MENIIVEKSNHPHVLETTEKPDVKEINENTLDIQLKGNAIVTHGEHGTLKIDTERVIKYNQYEVNPVTKELQKVFD